MNKKKMLQIILDALVEKRNKYAGKKDAARYGMEHGERAQKKYEELTEVIEWVNNGNI